MAISVGVIGVPGRMASRVVALLGGSSELVLTVALARPEKAQVGRDSGVVCGVAENGVPLEAFSSEAFFRAEVWIEFAHASATAASVAAARAAKTPLLVCTTGHDDRTARAIADAAAEIPVLLAPNTSLGVCVLNAALRLTLAALGASYAAEIVELHHDRKRDAPSGTALRLARTIAEARPGARVVSGREGARAQEEIGVFGVRGGNVIGEHTVYLLGAHDRIELTHRAQDRDLFAEGALHAAAWLAQKAPGAYTMEDCLNLARGNVS